MANTKQDVIDMVTIQLSTSATSLAPQGYDFAVDTAMNELGWVFPITSSFKFVWAIKRSLRHACYVLWVASAQKFKYKQVNLQQRFDHYEILVKYMDKEYGEALSTFLSDFSDIAASKMFGTAVGAGFSYDYIGRELTYTDLSTYLNLNPES